MPFSSNKRSSILVVADAVDTFVASNKDTVADGLRQAYRSSHARAVSKLPENAIETRDAAKSDLKTCIEMYALAEASLCALNLRAGNFIKATQAADSALAVVGLQMGASLFTATEACKDLAREAHASSLSPPLLEIMPAVNPPVFSSPYPAARCVSAGLDCDAISIEKFKEMYFDKDLPVVLKGTAKHWPAVKNWRNAAFLDKLVGFRMVPVEISVKNSAQPPREECVCLQRVLTEMHIEQESNEIMYLAQHPIFDYMPELKEHIQTPKYVQAGGSKEASLINVWMGSESSGTRLHYDSTDNFLVQIVGWKRVILFSQDQNQSLHIENATDNFSPVDVDNPDLCEHPKFAEAKGESLILGPGDMLYIPANHWHWVRAISPSISVNFWF